MPISAGTYRCNGLPHLWRNEDVVSFMESAGWQHVQILRRPFRKGEWRIYATPPTTDLAQFIQGDADLIVTAARCTGNRKPEKEMNTRWRPEKPSGHGFGFGRSLGFGPLRTSSPGPAKAMDEDGGENAEHMDVEPPSGEGKAEKAAGTGKRHSPTDGKSQTNSGKKTKAEDIDP